MSIPTLIKLPYECGGRYAIKQDHSISGIMEFDFATTYSANDWFSYCGDSYRVMSEDEVKELSNGSNRKKPPKTVGRDKLRHQPLGKKCYDAETVRPTLENGEPSMYVFCRGYDGSSTCQKCNVYMPYEDWERDFI